MILAGLVVGRGLKLATRVAIGRLLGAASLGLFDLAWTLVLVLSHTARGGLQLAMVRFGSPLWQQNPRALVRLVRRGLVIPLSLGGAVAVALIAAAPWIATGLFDKPELVRPIRVLALIVPLSAGVTVLAGAAQAAQRMRQTAFIRDLAEPALHLGLFLALWSGGLRLDAALWSALLAAVVAFGSGWLVISRLIAARSTRREAPEAPADPPGLRALVFFSLPVALSAMLVAYLLWADRLLVGYFLSASKVGVYSAASQFGILFTLALHGLSTMFTPMFSDMYDRRETARMRELYRVSTKWGLCLLLPAMACLGLLPEVALGGLFGHEFITGSVPLRILLLGQLINVATGHVGMVLLLTGSRRAWMGLAAGALVLNIGFDLLWIPRFGLSGAAAASSLSAMLLFGGGLLIAYSRLGLAPMDRRFWKLVPATAAAVVALQGLRWLELRPSLIGCLLALGVSFAAFTVVMIAMGVDREDRELLSQIRLRLVRT